MKAIMKIATTACLGLHGARGLALSSVNQPEEEMQLTDEQVQGMGSEEQQLQTMQIRELEGKLVDAGMFVTDQAKLLEYLTNSDFDVDTAFVMCLTEVNTMPVVQATASAVQADASGVAEGVPVVQADVPVENQEMGDTLPTGMSDDERAMLEAMFANAPEKAVELADFLARYPAAPFETVLEVFTTDNGLDVMSAEGTTTPPLQQQPTVAEMTPNNTPWMQGADAAASAAPLPRDAVAAVMGGAQQQGSRGASLTSMLSLGGGNKDVAKERRSGNGWSRLRGGMGARKSSGGRGNGKGSGWRGMNLFGGRGRGASSAHYEGLSRGLLDSDEPQHEGSGIAGSINGGDGHESQSGGQYKAL